MSLLNTELGHEAVALQDNAVWHSLIGTTRAPPVSQAHNAGRTEHGRRQLMLAQLLDSRGPLSRPQIWHADNTQGGYTVVVALCHVTADNGPTAIQLGSHHNIHPFPHLGQLWRAWCRPTMIATPQLRPGDVLVYSSAALHRGEANPSTTARPVLVYRYDHPSRPAPGVGALGSQSLHALGSLLAI
jgi:hypothetical protein